MRYGLNTFNHSVWMGLPPTLPEQIAAAGAVGYDAVGLDLASLLAHEASGSPVAEIAARVGDAGLAVGELTYLTLGPDRDAFRRDLDDVRRVADALDAPIVQAAVLGGTDDATVDALRTAARAVAGDGRHLAIEYIAGLEVCSIAQVRGLIERADAPDAGVCVDTFHFFHGPDTWEDLAALPRGTLRLVQFDDAPAPTDGGDVATTVLEGRMVPGEGGLALEEFARAVLDRGDADLVSVEVLSAEWRARPVEAFARATLEATRAIWERAAAG